MNGLSEIQLQSYSRPSAEQHPPLQRLHPHPLLRLILAKTFLVGPLRPMQNRHVFPLANSRDAEERTLQPPLARRLRRKSRYTVFMRSVAFQLLFLIFLTVQPARSMAQVLDARLHHLRSGEEMEWDEFADTP